jgi:SAM-dependent methyltransferase
MRWFGWFRWRGGDGDGGIRPTALIGGRWRTRGIPYQMPLDLEEMNRLDFQHFMLRSLLRGNYIAPVHRPQSILDVGTGTGRWARELAVEFPHANVIGLDVNLPPIDEVAQASKTSDLRPPNYTFAPGNILEGLPFKDGSFDFVHMRALITAIPHDRWPFVVSELMRVTHPGGWVESLEVTPLERGGPAISQLMVWLTAVLKARNVEFADGGKVGDRMHEAGLARVKVSAFPMPCGDSGGRIGKMLAVDWFSVLGALGGMMVARGITTADQLDRTLSAARIELASPHMRCVMPTYIAYGQRAR